MDSYIQMEEIVFSKMQKTLTHRFNLESNQATELALELVEILNASEANLIDFDQLYFS